MDPDPRFPAQAGIRTIFDEPSWRRFLRRPATLHRAAWLAGGSPGLSIVLSNDRTVRRLNARHRGIDRPTNVLSFEPPGPGCPGELVLALGTIRREAAASGVPVADHVTHLVVHGALHLAGHDHEAAGQARRMEMTEARLLARLGVANPWRPRRMPS